MHNSLAMDMYGFRAALFDLDGTLIDTEGQYSLFWNDIAARLGLPPDFTERIKGTTLTDTMDRYFPDRSVRGEVVDALNEFEARMEYVLLEGVGPFLSDIRAHGVRTAVVTSSNADKMANVSRGLPGFLEGFDAVLTAEDFPASKPDPSCYLMAASVLGCATGDCVVFEDAPNGLKAGRAAGIFTICVGEGWDTAHTRGLCDFARRDFAGWTYHDVVDVLHAASPAVS